MLWIMWHKSLHHFKPINSVVESTFICSRSLWFICLIDYGQIRHLRWANAGILADMNLIREFSSCDQFNKISSRVIFLTWKNYSRKTKWIICVWTENNNESRLFMTDLTQSSVCFPLIKSIMLQTSPIPKPPLWMIALKPA